MHNSPVGKTSDGNALFSQRVSGYGQNFMTLQRRSPAVLRAVANAPRSAWRTVHLKVPHRMYQNPKVIDRRISLRDYEGPVRQLLITELGHEQPTIVLTNDLNSRASKRIERYARRMLIENGLADAVDFFHLDALSSAVRLKVDFDVTLAEIATGLYRMMARQLRGYEAAKSRQIFRHFLDMPAEIEIDDRRVEVILPKRAHNPILMAGGVGEKAVPVPRWGNRRLSFNFR
jgi:hypothetical protein